MPGILGKVTLKDLEADISKPASDTPDAFAHDVRAEPKDLSFSVWWTPVPSFREPRTGQAIHKDLGSNRRV